MLQRRDYLILIAILLGGEFVLPDHKQADDRPTVSVRPNTLLMIGAGTRTHELVVREDGSMWIRITTGAESQPEANQGGSCLGSTIPQVLLATGSPRRAWV